ncbi:MAG: hypothetical protein ACYDBJ_15505 [Aggregatilineales bacterium]
MSTPKTGRGDDRFDDSNHAADGHDAQFDAAAEPARPVLCACGRPLRKQVSRDRVILRCPEHGVQFRYVVGPDDSRPSKRAKRSPTE